MVTYLRGAAVFEAIPLSKAIEAVPLSKAASVHFVSVSCLKSSSIAFEDTCGRNTMLSNHDIR